MRFRDVRGTQSLGLVWRQRLSGLLGQLLLLFGKRNWRRRGRGLSYYGAVSDGSWWPSHVSGRGDGGPKDAFAGWSHHSPRCYRRSANLFQIHWYGCSRYRRRTPKNSLRDSGHRARNSPVHIRNVRDGGIVRDLVVIDVGDGRRIHVCVAGVDAVEVSATGPICGHINFPGTQGNHPTSPPPPWPTEIDTPKLGPPRKATSAGA